MSLPPPGLQIGKTAPQIRLIPWDPDSGEHIKRMIQQRKTCGWKQDAVESWIPLQKKGDMSLHWIVLEGDGEKTSLHLKTYRKEHATLIDSAISLGGESRSPTHSSFTPIGHISLDSSHPSGPELGNKALGLYSINLLYISRALHSLGIGRAAMDEVESLAQREPLNAKTLALMTVASAFPTRDAKLKAQGREKPKIALQDWYERRGYVVFKHVEKAWEEVDLEGKIWWCAAVLMRKELSGGEEEKEAEKKD